MKIKNHFHFISFISLFCCWPLGCWPLALKASETLKVSKILKAPKYTYDNMQENFFLFLNPNKKAKFFYFSNLWNQDPLKKEKALLFLQLTKSRQLILIELQEKNPSSSLFEGHFSFRFKDSNHKTLNTLKLKKLKKIKALRNHKALNKDSLFFQIYLVPKKIKEKIKNFKHSRLTSYTQKILKNNTKPHPYVLNISLKNHTFYIFDSKESMEKNKKNLIQKRNVSSLPLKIFIENQKLKILKKENKSLTPKEKEKKKVLENQFREKALLFYKNKDFLKAEKYFEKSYQINPHNKDSTFQYAVSLYRNKKFKEALSNLYLSQAKKNSKREIEINYFKALTHYKLNEMEKAYKFFKIVRQSKDTQLSPISGFYEGALLYSKKKFKRSLKIFKSTLKKLKKSKDNTPEAKDIRKQITSYIERIKKILAYKKAEKKPFFLHTSLGALYDSNPLLEPYNKDLKRLEHQPSQKGSFRWLLNSHLLWPFYKKDRYQLQLKADTFYLYSLKDSHSFLDPFLFSISAPFLYHLKSKQKKIKVFELSPFFETLFIDLNRDGKRENILNSFGLKQGLSMLHGKKWKGVYETTLAFDLNKDEPIFKKNQNEFQTQDLKALQFELLTRQVFFLKANPEETLSFQLKILHSNSTLDSRNYYQMTGELNFSKPIKRSLLWGLGTQTYTLLYPQKDFFLKIEKETVFLKRRKDFFLSLYTDLKFSFNSHLGLRLWGGYLTNHSSVNHYKYKNLSLLLNLEIKI